MKDAAPIDPNAHPPQSRGTATVQPGPYRPLPDVASLRAAVRGDWNVHGRRVEPAFVAMATFRFGQWAISRQRRWARTLANKFYGLLNFFVTPWTRVFMPPQTRIGKDFHIIHCEGSISIHPGAVIGDRLGVMHNVTIGTNMGPEAPVIGDDVFIGVNSCVLGGIRIGNRVRIGANTAVTTDVPDDCIAVGSPARIVRRLGPLSRGA
ncbi:serine acetyltransferase [Paracoccus sp. Z118]|uniref:serine O-acetyltransferase n=1 Tax=Paracoccus sp. Z118 TaxID=2851017 RepID=UPI001C2C2A08|nr:serine acetyltransferase [Paracoccus sp. Z118]MBV0891398.1 serine acetyltransferase [Paracoccus sp. Z118]